MDEYMDEHTIHILTTHDFEELLWLMDHDHAEIAIECLRAILLCGPNARRILAAAAQGLVAGRGYGDWEKPRDYAVEAMEEYRDAHLYCTQRELQLLDELSNVRAARDLSDRAYVLMATSERGARA